MYLFILSVIPLPKPSPCLNLSLSLSLFFCVKFNSLDLVDEVREIETMIAKDNWAKSLVDILEVSTVQYLRLYVYFC